MRRKLITAVGCVAVLLAAWVGLRIAMAPKPGVTMENFKLLYVGMPIAEVVALMGDPPLKVMVSEDGPERIRVLRWQKREVGIFVEEEQGGVISGRCWRGPLGYRVEVVDLRDAPSVLESIRRWLGLDRPLAWFGK